MLFFDIPDRILLNSFHTKIRMQGGLFLAFECMQCGECCGHLGLMWVIEKEISDYTFLIRNEYTGERYTVEVTGCLRSLFDDKGVFTDLLEACPFFRKGRDNDLWYCTVHLTRPDVCRDYGCWRFLFLDPQGNRAGRVMGTRHLHADNPDLQAVWDEKVRTLTEIDDALWDHKMCEIVRAAGFTVRD